jgi:hypothetical protein
MVSPWFGFVIGVAALLAASVASAQADAARVSLRWAAPEQCSDDLQVVRQIEALLGERLADVREQSLAVHAKVEGSDGTGYVASLSLASPTGTEERTLEHPDCAKLVRAVALVVALAIDPERVQTTRDAEQTANAGTSDEATPPAPVTPPQIPPVAVPVPPIAPRREVTRDRPEGSSPARGARLALHGAMGAGPLPKFGVALDAALGFRRGHVRAELVGRYWAARQSAIADAPPAALELGLATLGARLCWTPILTEWRLSACAGGDIGSLRGRGTGTGLDAPRSRNARYSQLAGGLQVEYPRFWLAPEAGFEVSGALERPPFGVRENGVPKPTFRPALVGFTAFVGLAFEL